MYHIATNTVNSHNNPTLFTNILHLQLVTINFASMKACVQLYLLLYVLLSLYACGHKPYPRTLITADSLASANPTSAIILLNSLKNEMGSAPQATQMYYQLLCIKANDKAYTLHTSDSLILPVLHYYIEKDDKQHLPEAYYYAGRVYRDLEDAPQALDYFKKALEALPENRGYKLKGQIYSQMGTLFSYQNIHDEALKMYKEVLKYNNILKDSASIIFNLRDIAYEYRCCDKTDSALYYYQEAFDSANALKNAELAAMVQSQIAGLYIQLEKYELARKVLQHSLNYMNIHDKSGIYSIAAKLYHKINCTDSAIYYYKELLECGTIYAKKLAHKGLAQIALELNNPREASIHYLLYEQYSDSINEITHMETIRRMNSQYNYQLREKENIRLRDENEQKTLYIFSSLAAFIIAVASFFAYRQYSKRKQEQLKFQLQRVKKLEEDNYKKSRLFIENNNTRIKELEEELNSATSANEDLRKALQEQKELLYHETRQAEISQEMSEQAKSVLHNTSIYLLLKEKLLDPKGKVSVTTNEWIIMEDTLRDVYQDFFDKLNDIYSFNQYELRVCILVKYGFAPSEIAKITDRPKETITSTRRRLYNRIFHVKGKPEDWDNFILSL